VGTLLLVKEDQHTRYSQILLRYFLAQGVAHGHGVLVASADEAPQELLKKLPSWTKETDKQETTTEQVKDDRMKIAWRYQHLKKIDSSTPNQSTSGLYRM
jgi:elongator complex protein 4